MTMTATAVSPAEVPVLDLKPLLDGSNLTSLAEELRQACLNTGFFYVSNHGVSDDLAMGMFDVARRYFAMPTELRLEHKIDDRFRRGYVPFGISKIPGFEADLKERFDWGVDLPLDDPFILEGKPLYAPNKWPNLPWMRQPLEQFSAEMTVLGKRILRLIALSLGAPQSHFENMFSKSCTTHNMIHYPPQERPDGRTSGASEHTDFGLLTLLLQDPIGGLEVKRRDGTWIAAPYIPGTFIINLGDLFKVWTNDVYVSNFHRVVNRTGKERYSFPTFLNTDYDVVVQSVETCVSSDNPPKYQPIRAGDYLLGRFREVQGYKL